MSPLEVGNLLSRKVVSRDLAREGPAGIENLLECNYPGPPPALNTSQI